MKPYNMPEFKTETEEADWYFDHQDVVLKAFEDAAANGTLRQGDPLAEFEEAADDLRLQLKLTGVDATLAKTQAEKKGVSYETYVSTLIHEALAKEAAYAGDLQASGKQAEAA